jgi:hypothetical protein
MPRYCQSQRSRNQISSIGVRLLRAAKPVMALVVKGRDLVPRIAGQHSNYLKAQILEFNSTARPHGTMNSDEHKLTGGQVEALIDYLGND